MEKLKLLKITLKELSEKLIKILEVIWLSLEKAAQWFLKFLSNLDWSVVFWSSFSFFATCWGFYIYYKPDVEIIFTNPLKSNNIFTSVLNINNKGNCSVRDFTIHYELSDFMIKNKYGSTISTEEGVVLKGIDPLPVQKIITEKKSKSIDFDIGRMVSMYGSVNDGVITYKAKLKLHIEYKYWYNRKTKVDTLYFRTSELIDNNIIWIND